MVIRSLDVCAYRAIQLVSAIMLCEEVDFKTILTATENSQATVPHTYRGSQSRFIFNKSTVMAKYDPLCSKSTLFFTVKLDPINSFANMAEVRHIYLKLTCCVFMKLQRQLCDGNADANAVDRDDYKYLFLYLYFIS